MKIPRKVLLIILAGLGMFIISYSLFRHFTGIGLDEEQEKRMINIVIFTALGIFIYNRKLFQDEKRAKNSTENEKQKIEEPPEEKDLPHWERHKNDDDSKDCSE